MRVTDRQQVDALTTAIRDLRGKIDVRHEQIASGKRVNRPSDDPAAAERINQFRNVLRTTERRLVTVNEGIGRLNLSDSVLDSAGNILQRTKELALQMRNDSHTADERRNAAQEVHQLLLSMAGLANTQLNGRFLFAGSQTQTESFVPGTILISNDPDNAGGATVTASPASASALQPDSYSIEFTSGMQFDVRNLTTNQLVSSGNSYFSGTSFSLSGLDVTLTDGGGPPVGGDNFYVRVGFHYQGDDTTLSVEIGDGQTVETNIPGNRVFSGPGPDVFQHLQDFHQALVMNDVHAIQKTIDRVDQSLSQVLDSRATIGSRVNRMDMVKDSLDLLDANTQAFRSSFEDADFAKVASDLATLQHTLEASMATLARQFETNLLKFIQ